jgi:small-conductance mechanosensitive channel
VVTLIFVLSLAPLFDLHAPAIYIESTQFLLMLLLTLLFRKRLDRKLFYGWCLFILLFLLQPITRILGLPVFLSRWASLIQDSLSVVLGLLFFFSKVKMPGKSKVFSFAVGLYIFFNLLAVVCNMFGRVSLSQIFESTGVYGLAQTISLAVFVRLVVEAFLLQIQTSRLRKKYPEQFESTGIARSIGRFSTVLAVFLWLIVFTINLNIFDSLNDLLTDLFTDPRQVGSFSFTVGGAVLFLGIIWLANFLQKYIAYFFGDVGDDASFDDKGQLILLILGFLLAIAASGLPVDRITVIIGALGVGIGLGLQSIVNNFVSGIILIFDRPLRIGDTVELGDKKGRVKDISIRSSTLITEDGAEVIIPNGDVLSHNIVNWTLSNSHVRATLTFTIDKPTDPSAIDMAGIREIIRSNPNVLESRDPEIVLNTITSKSMEVKVFFWCKDIGKVTLTSGEIRTAIYEHLAKKGITVA